MNEMDFFHRSRFRVNVTTIQIACLTNNRAETTKLKGEVEKPIPKIPSSDIPFVSPEIPIL